MQVNVGSRTGWSAGYARRLGATLLPDAWRCGEAVRNDVNVLQPLNQIESGRKALNDWRFFACGFLACERADVPAPRPSRDSAPPPNKSRGLEKSRARDRVSGAWRNGAVRR